MTPKLNLRNDLKNSTDRSQTSLRKAQFDSYLDNPTLRAHARSKSILSSNVEIPKKLMKRLTKIQNFLSLKYAYLNKTTGGIMSKGQIFGDIALDHNVRRQASIYSRENTILAYIEKDDYDRVLRHIHKQDTNK